MLQFEMPRGAGAAENGPLPIVLSYGMGIDSTALLLRWLREPASRLGPLEDLTVLVAQLGDEWPDTYRLVERHILPLLRNAGVRFVQIGRRGPSLRDGVTVLDDSRHPTRLFAHESYPLSGELRRASTVPIAANRRCTLKFKGWVLDEWLATEFGERPFIQAIGFNAEEGRRVARDSQYYPSTDPTNPGGSRLPGRRSAFPLVRWGWGRAEVEDYCKTSVGVAWEKSCCAFCPFQRGTREDRGGLELPPKTLARFRAFPVEGAQVLALEHMSLVFNPRIPLFAKYGTLRETLKRAKIFEPLEHFERWLDAEQWALYQLRRIVSPTRTARSIRRVGGFGTRQMAVAALHARARALGREVSAEGGIERVYFLKRSVTKQAESFWVASPSAQEKEPQNFGDLWEKMTSERIDDFSVGQLPLFAKTGSFSLTPEEL